MTWLRFLTALLPVVHELIRELYERHSGSVQAAKAELSEIRDHGRRLDATRAAFEERARKLREGPGT